jgi:hypothetical protein
MLSLFEYAACIRNVCVDGAPSDTDLARLGGDEWRWRRYRHMVRRRLSDTIRHAFPRLESALGPGRMSAVEEEFFGARALKSVFIREVPGEFLTWLERSFLAGSLEMAPYAVELARLEWTELLVAYEKDDPALDLGPLSMERPAAVTRAHRLLALKYAVHLFDAENPAEPEPRPTHVLVYRAPETHEVHVLETTPVTNALIAALSSGTASLHECIAGAASSERIPVDPPFLEALADLLADLSERGVVRGGSSGDSVALLAYSSSSTTLISESSSVTSSFPLGPEASPFRRSS